MIAGDIRPATECAGATISAWNAATTGRDGVRAGGTLRLVAHDYRATTHKAPSADDEASCDAATGATECGGAGATVAFNAAAAEREAAPTGCLTDGMATRYGGAAANEAGAEHPLSLYGHCMFTMVMSDNGHGFLANLGLRVGRTS